MPSRSLLLLVAGLIVLSSLLSAKDPPPVPAVPRGALPRGMDGKPLNLDFETGDLRDWTAEGEAFKGQPIKGDTVSKRRADMKSEHEGNYWIGGYELHGDKPQGTLTSAPFKVTHRWAAFLVGGGPHESTCVELVRKDTGKVFHRSPGHEAENMRRVVVDLEMQMGQEIFIRLVDKHSGHWGHVNFDDFKFYETKPNFPAGPKRITEIFPYAGLPPDKAAEVMTLPEGFKVTAFAGEPDIRQPIAMTIDHRGRLWVAECYSYPSKLPAIEAKDRILIFEDTKGTGKFDRRTVFYEGLNLVTGLEIGFGGVWVGQAPELLFIPIKEGEDKVAQPAGPPRVVLDGWGLEDTHETLNSFIWGPDGWLYGCHGVFTHSRVGKPGTPKEKRVPLNAGIWRYHPIKDKFEVFAHGTSNPWGVDFNDHGDCFLTCCVIPHLFHVIQGARYLRQGGTHFNPHTYADIQTIANHRHWVGNQWNDFDRAKSDASGGGHAHAGAMIYLGDAWPEKYRGQLFMNNIHGARLNVDRLTPKGSGYVGDGEPDFLKANDLWSQILYLRYGPDGQVYMIDWYDKNQCHHGDPAVHDRTNGRIFKITYDTSRENKRPDPLQVDLSKKTDVELAQLQLHKNDWYVRMARRLLMERAAAKKLDGAAREALAKIAFEHSDVTRRLRGLWALHVTGGLNAKQIETGLKDENAHVRAWTIQLTLEDERADEDLLKHLATLAKSDSSPIVRLAIASALQRLPLEQRWDIAANLLSHSEDSTDHNLPLMYWYAIEPLGGANVPKALALGASSGNSMLLSFMIRRVGSSGLDEVLELLVRELGTAKDSGIQLSYLRGLQQALVGRRQVTMPKSWPAVYKKLRISDRGEVRQRSQALGVTFGDPAAFVVLRDMLEGKASADDRRQALAALLAVHDRELVPRLHSLLKDPALRGDALRGLAAYDDSKTPDHILGLYSTLAAAEKRDALATLTSRVSYAKALLAAIGAKKVASTDLTADFVRQLRNLKDAELNKQIATAWGVVRESPAEKAKQVAHYKQLVQSRTIPEKELPQGRAVFARVCQQCHTLFDTGGKVGPDITGSNRRDLDYLLSNILDPSAVMAKEYIPSLIETKSGRIVTGIIKEHTQNALTLVTANETVIVPRDEIETITASDKSMMPDDLLKPLSEDEVCALLAYLGAPRQVPLPATADNVKAFFNGKDLTGWKGNPKLWSVDKGEIVGKSPGIKRNEFLINELLVGDFKLTLQVKLVPDRENSGVQFRSEELPGGEVKGYQADIGAGWWGKLYEEHGRGLLTKESGEKNVKVDDWNRYEIIAAGSKIKTYINGQLCVDVDDPKGARHGIFALQIHSGGPMEVRFKDMKLELLEKK
jgi:putative membrane-bound dehydrogenase-like protein